MFFVDVFLHRIEEYKGGLIFPFLTKQRWRTPSRLSGGVILPKNPQKKKKKTDFGGGDFLGKSPPQKKKKLGNPDFFLGGLSTRAPLFTQQ